MKMLTKQTKFILAIALQMAIIFAIIIFKLLVLTGRTGILLEIEPMDPRDLLRGDYATFQYSISNLDSYYLGGQQIRNGDTVYVVLRRSGKYWTAQSVQKSQPTGNEIFIKGRVESRFHIIYGVEQYFIPEGKGRNLDFRNKEAAAKVIVDDNGNAVLKQIYIDDKPWP